MVYLTNGILKNCYEKCIAVFERVIDCNMHINAYVGEHENGFAESEFAGKYLDCCVNFYKHTKSEILLDHAKNLVNGILANQHSNGYLGGYAKENEWITFSVWNQAFTVYGLLSYYKLTRDDRVLECAEKCVRNIAEHYMNEEDDILDSINAGTEHISILITLPELYTLTGNKLYLDFFEYIMNRLKNSTNNFFEFDTILNLRSKKGIENFMPLIAMVMYYEIKGDAAALRGAKKYWNELEATQIRRPGNGTIGEHWTAGGNAAQFLGKEINPNETCVSVGWGEFSAVLFKQTKEAKYLDALEKVLYNHLIGSMNDDGSDFAYYQPNYGKRITRTSENAYKCCRYRGFNAFSKLPDILFYEDDEDIVPMVYTASEYANDGIKIAEETNYPFDDRITFKISGNTDKHFKLRIPCRCQKYTLTVNGTVTDARECDGYIALKIKDGDVISLKLNTTVSRDRVVIQDKNYVGYSYGCIVLVADSNVCSDIYGAKNTEADLTRNFATEYNIEFRADDFCLVDYASAGKKHETDEICEWIFAGGDDKEA